MTGKTLSTDSFYWICLIKREKEQTNTFIC